MEKSIFLKYCETSLQVLNAQFEVTRLIKHNATNGQIREQILRDFLKEHLPELIHIVSGQIIDSRNNYTKQQDAVLVLKKSPRLPFSSGDDLIFMEGVISTIEIKSKLDANTLKSIGENLSSIRSLKASSSGARRVLPTHKWRTSNILTSIITYGGNSLESHISKLLELDESAKPDLIFDLGKGLIIKNHGLLIDKESDDLEYIIINSPSKGFMMFLTFLTEIASSNVARGIRWRSYWG